MPQAQPAKTYPAHDEHPLEAVAVAVDPYDLAEKTNIFSVKYSEIGFLPIFVVVTNDGNQPVQLAGMKAQLVTVNRAKLSPAGQEDIARRLTRPSANTNRYPIPFPTKKVKGGLSKQASEEIQNAQFEAKAVEPHSSQSGFHVLRRLGHLGAPGGRALLPYGRARCQGERVDVLRDSAGKVPERSQPLTPMWVGSVLIQHS